MKRSIALHILVILLALMLLPAAAHADSVGITLTQTTESGNAGDTVTFDATVTNLTTSTVFLNGDASTTSTPNLTVDDTPFLTNFPLSLAPGASSGPFAFFDVLIAPGTLPGSYGFNTFTLEGGPTSSDFESIGSATYTVDVSPVPEPGTLLLLGSGLVALGIKVRLQRRAS